MKFIPTTVPDYQRIYQVAYSVLEASEIAITHRACIFFASVGTLILRDHYQLPATISAGCMAMMVDERAANVAVYGRNQEGAFVSGENAFHAWCQCDGWLIDFMAPIMGTALCAKTELSGMSHDGCCKSALRIGKKAWEEYSTLATSSPSMTAHLQNHCWMTSPCSSRIWPTSA